MWLTVCHVVDRVQDCRDVCSSCPSNVTPRVGVAQIDVTPTKQLPLASFRGSFRPVLLVGSRGHLAKCIKAAETVQAALQARGVAIVPLEVNADDPSARLKALKSEFRCEMKFLETFLVLYT